MSLRSRLFHLESERSQNLQASTSSPEEIKIGKEGDLGDKNILRLDVPVQYVEAMDVLHSENNLKSFIVLILLRATTWRKKKKISSS